MLAVGSFSSLIPFRGRAVRTSPPSTLHSIAFSSFHPPQHHTASGNTHFHFASSIHSVFPKPFPHAFPIVYFLFLRRVSPIKSPEGRAESNYTLSVRCCAFRKYKNHNKTPPPISCAVNKNITNWFIHMLAVYAFIPAHYIPGTTFVPHFAPLHFIPLSFHAYTSAPHSFGSLLPFHSASSIHSVTTQAFSPRISSGMFYFLRRVSPNKTKPLRESGKREECFNLDYHWRLSRE